VNKALGIDGGTFCPRPTTLTPEAPIRTAKSIAPFSAPYAHAVDVVFLDPAGERRARDPHNPDRREVHARDAGAPVDGEPNLTRILCTEAVEAERSEQAEDALRHAPRDLGQRVVLSRFRAGRTMPRTSPSERPSR
jgi:hypothetical protein